MARAGNRCLHPEWNNTLHALTFGKPYPALQTPFRCMKFPPVRRLPAFLVSLLVACLGTLPSFGGEPKHADWPAYLGGKTRSLFSPLTQITRENVGKLEPAWTFDTGGTGEYQANNLIVGGVLYTH